MFVQPIPDRRFEMRPMTAETSVETVSGEETNCMSARGPMKGLNL